jgi:hypothetical protein
VTAINNSTYGDTGLPVVSSVITIEGNNSTITRDPGAPAFRIFAVNGTGNLTLNETTVSGGAVTGSGFVFGIGGGVANDGGTVALARSTVSGNSSEYLCGGVCNRYGTLTLTNSTVSGNSAGLWGGGVFNDQQHPDSHEQPCLGKHRLPWRRRVQPVRQRDHHQQHPIGQ